MNTNTQSTPADAVSARAYQLWEAAGRPEGRDLEFWLHAEQELNARPEGPVSTKRNGKAAQPRTIRERGTDRRTQGLGP